MTVHGRRRTLLAFACLAAALIVIALLGRPAGAGAAGGSELAVQPSLGAPAEVMLGASPQEAPGEVWATAKTHDALARYTTAGGWETEPPAVASDGSPIPELELALGASAGRTTPNGGVAVEGTRSGEKSILLVRDPGGGLREAPEPAGLLKLGEGLFGAGVEAPPMLAAAEAAGHTRAFVVPERRQAVLDFNGESWSAEQVCTKAAPAPGCEVPAPAFRILAIEAGGGEAWLLAKNAAPGEGIELFRREATGGPGGTPAWRQQSLGGPLGAHFEEAAPLGVPLAARGNGQPLTVTEKGVWTDAVLSEGGESHEATFYYDIAAAKVTASWCDLTSHPELCTFPLGSELPGGQARSFAWPSSAPYGQRVVTGIGQGAILNLEGAAFNRIALAGGDAGADQGAALSAPEEGWLGAKPPLQLTHNPEPSHLQPWPVAFRRPLLAVASAPGAPIGGLGSEALAAGDNGQVARYVPGQGWEPESLLRSSGKRATPTLRGIAWPVSGRAYAVGDNAAMWLWQRSTGLWEPDPAEPADLARANFTGVAFDPNQPNRGYAVGKQGLLLAYGREWTREALPAGVPPEANFTSIAFAGDEALATYKFPIERGGSAVYTGGVLANDGSGWRVDQGAEAALGQAIPQRVAGLPDGGAVIASMGSEAGISSADVIERQGAGAPWQVAAGGSIGYPTALAAIREGGQVRAIVSVTEGQGGEDLNTDREQVFNQPPPGQPPLLTDPYPLPGGGVIARQTATGWRDEEHQQFPLPARVEGQTAYDLPAQPDPVLALLLSPEGEGWAVGGETGTFVQFQGESLQTAGVMRYGAAAAPPANAAAAPVLAEAGTASFAIGGNAQCAATCADLAGAGIGPDRWLKAAVGTASRIAGVRGFLYTGPSVAEGREGRLGATLSPAAFSREEAAYARRLGSAAGALPTFAAPAESDLDRSGSLATFSGAFSGFGQPFGSAPPGGGISPLSQTGPGKGYYSFDSGGPGSAVQVIVLDYSAASLGDEQRCWLAGQLSTAGAAKVPAIVVGDRDLARQAPNAATDAGQVVPILLGGPAPPGCAAGPPAAASAYFFDFPEQNRTYSLNSGGRSIPAFGSGTLGYVQAPRPTESDFVGASGFLLASVHFSERNPTTNIAPVGARLIPNVGSLALDPTDGTLLRRSHQALFQGLARRPLAGLKCTGDNAPRFCDTMSPEPYAPIPTECVGAKCPTGIFPDYTFSSSEPDIADFVASDPSSLNPRNVLLVHNKPVLDPHSGLLCAFNEGTTTVTVSTGGLSYSQKVTVLGGTAQRPCGTTPLRNRPIAASPTPAAPPPAGEPPPTFSSPPTIPPPPPPAPAAPAAPAPVPPHPVPTPIVPPVFFSTPAQLATPIVPIVPPPPPLLLQPTPPSGSSYVQEREEEEEEAVEHSSLAVAERLAGGPANAAATVPSAGSGRSGLPIYALPALVLLAALAASSLRPRRPRRNRRQIAYERTTSPRRQR